MKDTGQGVALDVHEHGWEGESPDRSPLPLMKMEYSKPQGVCQCPDHLLQVLEGKQIKIPSPGYVLLADGHTPFPSPQVQL